MATVITQNELLEALAQANAAPAEARTVTELATISNMTKDRVKDAIGKLAMQDRIEVHMVPKRSIDGRNVRVPAYAIKPAPKAKR